MPKLNSNIYGADPTSAAEGVASDALSGGNGEDYWGGLKDSRANSWDGPKDPQPGDVDVVTNLKAGAGDDGNMDSDFAKVTPRHRTVSLADEDGVNTPPPRFSGKR